MKIIKKILFLMVIILLVFSLFSINVYATTNLGSALIERTRNAIRNAGSNADTESMPMRVFATIIRAAEVLASFWCVGKLSLVGIKYFTGSAKQKSEVKNGDLQKTLILIVIVFGASTIFEVLYRVFIG